jgi:LmbE family N-acetylglucosaminyl deacetylase
MLKRSLVLGCTVLLAVAPRLVAQGRGAAALGELIAGLGTTTRVLMIGAHPDDEDTQLIAYLAKARHIETAYLSLTRGDGGQNLIGNELGQSLGMIRTEELLAARRIDGGRQYFARAFDFGFSKTIDETYEHWPKDSVLKDMVAIVRAFRPQVIIAAWTGTPQDGHGHHQYSGVLSREVFDAAADSVRFPPSRVGGLRPWTVAKFYRARARAGGSLSLNVGEYDPLLGETYAEIATLSRSAHRSQGQGGLPQRGSRLDAVKLEVSRVSDVGAAASERGLFDGLDSSWARFKDIRLVDSARTALDSLPIAEQFVVRALDLSDPSKVVEPLARYVRLATRASSGVSCTTLTVSGSQPACSGMLGDLALALSSTRSRATDALLDAAGVTVEATAPRELIAQRDTMPVTLSVYNEGKTSVTLDNTSLAGQPAAALRQPRTIPADSTARLTMTYRGADVPTMPWWLRRPMYRDMFTQPLAEMVIGEDRLKDSGVDVVMHIGGVAIPVRAGPIVYRFADAVRGEVRRPVATVPEISVLLQHEVEYARANAAFERSMLVNVRSAATVAREVNISLSLPKGLTADSIVRRVTLEPFGAATVYFRVTGRLAVGRDSIRATATSHGESFATGFVPIEYEHIRPQRFYRASTVQIEAVNATFANLRVGYVRGVGDNVMPMLEELGLPVTELDPATLAQTKLSGFTTIVLGSRAYEANSGALKTNTPALLRFARDGGTVVTQYGQFEMAQPGTLPYPITLSRPADRVTDESSQVRVLDPGSPLLSSPNKIVDADFSHWVQDRALYMPRTFDKQYRPLFSMNDKDEPPNDGAVLVAPVGKGTYIYTTFAFFRQLPAGNPGAARLFINFLSADQRAANRPSATTSAPVRP